MGHDVSLFAHSDSSTGAKLYSYPGKRSSNKRDFLRNTFLINKVLLTERFDVVHSFGRLAYLLPLLPFSIPKIMSYQREPTLGQINKAVKLAKKGTLAFTGCSDYISKQIAPYAPSYTVYNGVPLETYEFKATVSDDAPLVFLGRIEPIKGPHNAIKAALSTNRKLVIAGNIPDSYRSYFNKEISPFLNNDIRYIGPVDDVQKNELLGNASAFLMPIEWDEPFGIVMAEALACGTPVIGYRKGAVPEVVKHGLNGFVTDSFSDLCECIRKVSSLKRLDSRVVAEQRFSNEVIVEEYLKLYNLRIG